MFHREAVRLDSALGAARAAAATAQAALERSEAQRLLHADAAQQKEGEWAQRTARLERQYQDELARVEQRYSAQLSAEQRAASQTLEQERADRYRSPSNSRLLASDGSILIDAWIGCVAL